MAMSGGSSTSGLTNEINVTPMIDVLLVLLIIFMMVIPMSRKAIDLQLPDPTPDNSSSGPPPSQIVRQCGPGRSGWPRSSTAWAPARPSSGRRC